MSKGKKIGNTLFYEETDLPKHLLLEFDSYDEERYGEKYYEKLLFKSIRVEAGAGRIRAQWTPELAQDLEAYHTIYAEAELTALLNAEINQAILNNLNG